jgi:hypothetical protein
MPAEVSALRVLPDAAVDLAFAGQRAWPAGYGLRGLAEQSLREAHAAAEEHGRTIAERVRAAA